jgi:hypothetical protein|nr:MAG TPA: endonuclease [Caudoviricetes sp.]
MFTLNEVEDIENIPIGSKVVLIEKGEIYNEKDLIMQISRNGCWEVISHKPDNNGYGQYKKKRTHVLMYEKYIGKIPKGMVIRHKCDNPICCNPFHLEIGTQKDNNRDKFDRNRSSSNITKELAIKIAKEYGTAKEISDKFNISKNIVYHIKNGDTWSEYTKDVLIPVSGKYKLNKEDVIDIYTSNLKGTDIAKKYGLSPNTVYDIRKKRIWTNITDKIDKGEI